MWLKALHEQLGGYLCRFGKTPLYVLTLREEKQNRDDGGQSEHVYSVLQGGNRFWDDIPWWRWVSNQVSHKQAFKDS